MHTEPQSDSDATTEPLSLGGRLRAARARADLSQVQAAEKISSTSRSIGRWEQDEVAPSFEDVAALADAYKVSVDWLAGRTNIMAVLRPGMVIVDQAAQEIMEKLASAKGRLSDVPERLVRHPGIDYAFTIPDRCVVFSIDAARAVDMRIQELVRKLKNG